MDANTPAVPTESEMANIRGIFERAANAIVGYSELGIKVSELQTAVDTLRRDLDRVREHNRWLEEQLLQTRHERDEARSELAAAKAQIDTATSTVNKLNDDVSFRDKQIGDLREQNNKLENELDETLGRAISAETELGLVKSKLEEAMDWLRDVQSLVAKPMPTVVETVPTNVSAFPEPQQAQEPSPEPPHESVAGFRW